MTVKLVPMCSTPTPGRAVCLKRPAEPPIWRRLIFSALTDDASVDVIKMLESYPAKIREAASRYEPSVVARYLVDLAQAFNKFYHDNVILCDDERLRNARLAAVDAVRMVLKSGLALLGIKAPERM